MNIPTFYQHKDDVIKYTWDFSQMLASGETISSTSVTAASGLTVASTAISSDSLKVTAMISSGVLYSIYYVTCQIVTSDSQTINRSISIQIIPL